MRSWLLPLLILLPIAELSLLLAVYGALAERFGGLEALAFTLGALFAAGVLGSALARSQGLRAVGAIQRSMEKGEPPGAKLLDAALIVAGGALLILPGYLSDLVGLTLLVPWTRRLYARGLERWFRRKLARGEAAFLAAEGRTLDQPGNGEVIIDVTPDDPSEAGSQNRSSPGGNPGSS